jgi:hypothetical protein
VSGLIALGANTTVDTAASSIVWCGIKFKKEIIASLEKTFRPSIMPAVFSEFTIGKEFVFEPNFEDIVKPLFEKHYLQETNGTFTLTDSGKTYLKDLIDTAKYRRETFPNKTT